MFEREYFERMARDPLNDRAPFDADRARAKAADEEWNRRAPERIAAAQRAKVAAEAAGLPSWARALWESVS